MREVLLDKDREIEDWQRSHENDIQEFKQQRTQWMEKEEDYKSDLKKLEVMIATGARGLEFVTLARSESAQNVTTTSEAIKTKGLEKEKELWHLVTDEGSFFMMMRPYAQFLLTFGSTHDVRFCRKKRLIYERKLYVT